MTINEAMVCGLPAVVSELVGCAPELVHEVENGFWCDPLSVEDMTQALVAMTEAPDWDAMSARSREIVASFHPDLWARRLMLCIERARLWKDA